MPQKPDCSAFLKIEIFIGLPRSSCSHFCKFYRLDFFAKGLYLTLSAFRGRFNQHINRSFRSLPWNTNSQKFTIVLVFLFDLYFQFHFSPHKQNFSHQGLNGSIYTSYEKYEVKVFFLFRRTNFVTDRRLPKRATSFDLQVIQFFSW